MRMRGEGRKRKKPRIGPIPGWIIFLLLHH
jgi:hypothetical protein